MLKVLLVNSPARAVEAEPIAVPPLGLAYLAAVARRAGHDVSVLDAFAEGLTWDSFRERVAADRWDLIGLSAMTPVFDTVKRALAICRPHTAFLVLGGPHATAFRTSVLEDNPELDAAVSGEGEATFAELLQALDGSRPIEGIPGVVTRGGEWRERPWIENLDDLPFPARDLLPNHRYRYPLCGRHRMTTMITSRGCPYQCTFCDKCVFGSRWRARSAENVLAEVDEAVARYGIESIVFYDDLFTLDQDRLHAICEGFLRRRGPRVSWKAEGRVNLVNPETLRLMRRAGCDTIAYGVESANQVGLDHLRKGTNPEMIRRAFRLTKEAGIRTVGYFILGIPVETYEQARHTIEFAVEIGTDYAQFGTLSPLPGTRLYDEARQKGWYREVNAQCVNDKGRTRPVIVSENWDEDRLVRIVREAHRRFYLRPAYLARSLLRARSPAEVRDLAGMGWRMVRYVFGRAGSS